MATESLQLIVKANMETANHESMLREGEFLLNIVPLSGFHVQQRQCCPVQEQASAGKQGPRFAP